MDSLRRTSGMNDRNYPTNNRPIVDLKKMSPGKPEIKNDIPKPINHIHNPVSVPTRPIQLLKKMPSAYQKPEQVMPVNTSPEITIENSSEARINEDEPEKSSRKLRAAFSILSFLLVLILAVFLGWYEYTHTDGSNLQKILSKSNSTTEKASALNSEKNTSAARNASAPASQTNQKTVQSSEQNIPAATNADNIKTGTTEPAEEEKETKNYKNEKEGVSFDYPTEYTISESNGQIVAAKTQTMWRMKLYDNTDKKDFKDWFSANFSGKNNTDCTEADPATLKIGTYVTRQEKISNESGKCDGVGFFALNTDKSIVVRIRLDKADEEEANKILSSFKFSK